VKRSAYQDSIDRQAQCPRSHGILAFRLRPSLQDGNGRMARFVVNAMLASDGYPWTVIRVGDRNAYRALDRTNIDMNIEPFAKFIVERLQSSMKHVNAKARTR